MRGKYKGRGRHSPYGRGGGGYQNRRMHKNDGGGGGKIEQPDGELPANHQASFEGSTPTPGQGIKSESLGSSPSLANRASFGGQPPSTTGSRPGEREQGGAETGGGSKEKKYSVKARLFVGNLPRDTTQDMVRSMFEEFGEVKEVFVQKEKSFGFVRMVSLLYHKNYNILFG